MKEFSMSNKKSKIQQLFQWNWNENIDPKIAFTRALITLIILWMVYACFQFSWQVVNQASNYSGPVYTLWPSSASNPTISRVSNWSVTITRGLVAIAIGLVITKIGHKKACIFAFSMMLLSFPFILTPQIKMSLLKSNMNEETASQLSYSLFVIFRIFLSIGGTAIMIAQTPVIAKFFVNPKSRNAAVKCGNIPAQAAGILASLIFINGVVKIGASQVAANWQLISGIVLFIVLALFITYLFIGMHFNISDKKVVKTELNDADKEKNSMLWLIKQPKVIIFLAAGMFSLYAGIEPGSGVLSNFWKTTTNNIALSWDTTTGLPIQNPTVSNAMLIWQMLYSGSLFLGIFTIGRWSNTNYPIARFSGYMICLGTSFWAISFGLGAVGFNYSYILPLVLITGILGSTLIFGTQALTGVIPYRWGFSNKQITNYAALSWTTMYVGYSILDIITAYVGTAGVSANMATIADYISNNTDKYSGLFNSGIDQEQMSSLYSSIKNILLGTSWTNLEAYLNGKNIAISSFNQAALQSVLNVNSTVATSVNNLANQYIPQITIISFAPLISGVIFACIKKLEHEKSFSFKDFKENHMDFHNLKRLSNKYFKTSFKVKEHIVEI